MARSEPPLRLFLQWLLLNGALLFALWLCWTQGLIATYVLSDPTWISQAILGLFVAACGHCGLRAWWLARELEQVTSIMRRARAEPDARLQRENAAGLRFGDTALPPSLASEYFTAVLGKYAHTAAPESLDHALLTDLLADHASGSHEGGWFLCGLLLKLGLLGTVIGFVMMLGSIATTDSFDVATLQRMLLAMGLGMKVALYTTMIGLIASMLLGAQYLALDRAADRLVGAIVHFAETELARRAG